MIDEIKPYSLRYLQANNLHYQRKFVHSKWLKTRLAIIIGQRGVGKTTALVQYLLNQVDDNTLSPEILYVPADNTFIQAYKLFDIAESFANQGGKWLVFDEIHRYADWSRELKSISDTFPELQVIASGSSALEIHRGSHDLSRRAIISTLHGLSYREFLEMKLGIELPSHSLEAMCTSHTDIAHEISSILNASGSKPLQYFSDYLQKGYYPYFQQYADDELFYITLNQGIQTTIDSDLLAAYPSISGHTVRRLKQLLVHIASMVPFTPKYNTLKGLLSVSDTRTLKNYLSYLEDAGLIRLLSKPARKLDKLDQPEKIYLNNSAQFYALNPANVNRGTIRELYFLSMLSENHQITASKQGDFIIDEKWTFEIGGRNKDLSQIKGINNAFIGTDDLEIGSGQKIPLWLFGFMY